MINHFQTFYKFLGNIAIKSIIGISLIGLPLFALILKINYAEVAYGWIFFVFICFVVVERVWETFYSSGDQKKHKLHGDWTLPLVSIAYILMLLGMIWEFFVINRGINIFVMLIGIFIYGMSFLLRISGMLTLREQWSVHAVGAKKVKNVFLVKSGPYKYLRHPIYLGVILEVLGLPLIWNAYFVFIFTCTVSVPLQLMRAYFEEKATVRKLGKEYIDYKKTVPALIPFRLLIRNNK